MDIDTVEMLNESERLSMIFTLCGKLESYSKIKMLSNNNSSKLLVDF
jgi:hypothetical protein